MLCSGMKKVLIMIGLQIFYWQPPPPLPNLYYGRHNVTSNPRTNVFDGVPSSRCMWNARALMHGKANSPIREHRICEVEFLCKSNAIVCIFEPPGGPMRIKRALSMIRSHVILPYAVKVNGVLVPGPGWIVILIHRSLVHPLLRERYVGRLSLGRW